MNEVNPIRILHVAVECGPAVFGGLGRVATQMMEAQNYFELNAQKQINSSIIAPFYPKLFKNFPTKKLVATVKHLYNDELIVSSVYLASSNASNYYLVEPPEKYKYLLDISSKPEIYADTYDSEFIERIKYFNSLVAAYVNDPKIGIEHPNPQVLQLHDWQASMVAKLLNDFYHNTKIKSVFMVHIDSGDRGTFKASSLQGIGLKFKNDVAILKAIGLIYADKIAAVSPKFLRECIETETDDPQWEYLRKLFTLAHLQNKAVGINNGIVFRDFCPIGKLIKDPRNLYQEKLRLKHELAAKLSGSRLVWKLDPSLPLILYVGRYSPEKGPEVFEQVIHDCNGRANFVAVGRGMTDNVFRVLVKHSRQTDNVFVTASEIEQAMYIELLRAAADIILIPSHRDAFGLVGPEGLANGSIILTTGVGGLKDVVQQLQYSNKDQTSGNGIFYEDMPEGSGYNPSLAQGLNQILNLWKILTQEQINKLQQRIIQEASRFDWCAPGGSIHKYLDLYYDLINTHSNSISPNSIFPAKRKALSAK